MSAGNSKAVTSKPCDLSRHVGKALTLTETPDTRPGREGWVKGVCSVCGQLIGYRPTFEFKRSTRRQVDRLDIANLGEADEYE
jgi:hypothetical protein